MKYSIGSIVRSYGFVDGKHTLIVGEIIGLSKASSDTLMIYKVCILKGRGSIKYLTEEEMHKSPPDPNIEELISF